MDIKVVFILYTVSVYLKSTVILKYTVCICESAVSRAKKGQQKVMIFERRLWCSIWFFSFWSKGTVTVVIL